MVRESIRLAGKPTTTLNHNGKQCLHVARSFLMLEHVHSQTGRDVSDASGDAELAVLTKRVQLQSPDLHPKAKTKDAPCASESPAHNEVIAEDSMTDFKTYWRIGVNQRYTDPTTKQTRDCSHRMVKKASDRNAKRYRSKFEGKHSCAPLSSDHC